MKSNNPKILIVGEFRAPIHEQALFDAMINLKLDVDCFKTYNFFKNASDFSYRLQYHFQVGPNVFKLNSELKKKLKNEYDIIFLYRPRLIYKSVIENNKAKIFIYNNDDPFSKKYHFFYWFNFKKLLPLADHIFAYRSKNLKDYKSIGLNNISLLRSWYIKEANFSVKSKKTVDVVFIGHFENDNRDYLFNFLIKNGVNLEIYGPGWEKSKLYKFFKTKQVLFLPLTIYNYNQKLNESKLAIVLFSKLNNDGYTRRCFEIPATKTPMLVFKTLEILSLFNENEAIFFETKEELLFKVRYYLKNSKQAEKIGISGFEKNLKSGNEVTDRVKQIIETFYSLS